MEECGRKRTWRGLYAVSLAGNRPCSSCTNRRHTVEQASLSARFKAPRNRRINGAAAVAVLLLSTAPLLWWSGDSFGTTAMSAFVPLIHSRKESYGHKRRPAMHHVGGGRVTLSSATQFSPSLHGRTASHPQNDDGEDDFILQWKECCTLEEFRTMLLVRHTYSTISPKTAKVMVLSPRVATAALKRLTQLCMGKQQQQQQHQQQRQRRTDKDTMDIRTEALSVLLEPIVQSLTCDPYDILTTQRQRHLDIVSTADCLVSLSMLISLDDDHSACNRERLAPIQLLLWGQLEDWHNRAVIGNETTSNETATHSTGHRNGTAISSPLQLSPKRLVMCLRAVQSYPDATYSALYIHIVQRLCQGDAQAQMDAADLAAILYIATIDNDNHNAGGNIAATTDNVAAAAADANELQLALRQLVVATARRLRKQKVREVASIATLVRVMIRTKQLCQSLSRSPPRRHLLVSEYYDLDPHEKWNDDNVAQEEDDKLRSELQVMLFTVTKQIVATLTNDTNAMNGTSTTTAAPKLLAAQAAAVCDTMRHAPLELNGDHTLVQCFCQTILPQQAAASWLVQPPCMHDVTRILSALEHWRAARGAPTTTAVVHVLGRAFAAHVQAFSSNEIDAANAIKPRDVNTILRCAALLLGDSDPESDDTAMTPYLTGAEHVLSNSNFLSRCGPTELANLAWFAAFKARGQFHNNAIVLALGKRILESDVVDSCSPKQASRILNAFTALCINPAVSAVEHEDTDRTRLLADLFRHLGEHLLSSHLSPLDASSAIYAYAKSSYVLDMGIFDHLVDVVASQAPQCSIRQIAQTVWACGKMIAFESIGNEDNGGVGHAQQQPPYVASAAQLVAYLAHHADQLSSKDVAQTSWAMSRLGLNDADLWEPLLQRVHAVSSVLTTQERANLLWSLRTMPITDSKVIFVLTRPFASPVPIVTHSDVIKPQEASNILYALGQLNIRDDQVFRNLTNVILDQIDATSAQSVANVLWAHRAVHIEPPRELLESWATRRLPGLVIASDPNANYPYY